MVSNPVRTKLLDIIASKRKKTKAIESKRPTAPEPASDTHACVAP
jgi:hypothetical protein